MNDEVVRERLLRGLIADTLYLNLGRLGIEGTAERIAAIVVQSDPHPRRELTPIGHLVPMRGTYNRQSAVALVRLRRALPRWMR